MCRFATAVKQVVCVVWRVVTCWAGVCDAGIYPFHVGVLGRLYDLPFIFAVSSGSPSISGLIYQIIIIIIILTGCTPCFST